jgi:hypothetical protein
MKIRRHGEKDTHLEVNYMRFPILLKKPKQFVNIRWLSNGLETLAVLVRGRQTHLHKVPVFCPVKNHDDRATGRRIRHSGRMSTVGQEEPLK